MHAAPPVRVDLGRDPGAVWCAALLAAAAAANAMAWVALSFEWPAAGATVSASAVLAAVLAARAAWAAQGPAPLVWDGNRWHWGPLEGQAHVAIDLDPWLLLRLDADAGGRTWIAASRRAAVGDWGALRAALYSARPADRLDAPPA